jgi:hypothetical protein
MTSSLAPGNVQYNYAQIEGIWTQAGGLPGAAPIAAAIAMAESGGNTTATDNDSNGTVDRGLWQINSVHGAQSTYDVMGNARAAIAISNNGTNWAAWTTYSSGAYRRYVQTGIPPDTSAPINATNAAVNQNTATLTGAFGVPGLPSILDPTQWFGAAAGGVSESLIKFFMQGLIVTVLNPMIQLAAGVAGITAGGVMVVFGIWMAARSTETGAAVEHGAGKVAGFGAQAAMTAVAPEATAATKYVGASGAATTVTQSRRPAGAVKIGGRKVQYRPATVRTTVDKPQPADTASTLRREAAGYNNKADGDGRKLSPTTSSTHKTYRGPGGAGGRGGSSGR